MKWTRTITTLLLLGLLLPVMAACGGTVVVNYDENDGAGGDLVTEQTTTPSVTTTAPDRFPAIQPSVTVNFAEEGLKGEDLLINVAYVEGSVGTYVQRSLQADWADESSVDVKTLERDRQLATRLGLELVIERVSSYDGMEAALESILMAGDPMYDLLVGYQYYALEMATKGYLLNLANLEDFDADYMNFDLPHWAEAYNRAINLKDACYWVTGDLALNYLGGMYGTFVNTELYGRYAESQYGPIYNVVKNGEWTVDLMTQMTQWCYTDNGNIAFEYDSEDTYGFGYEKNGMIDALALGMGVRYTYTDPTTGEIQFCFNNQHSFSVSEKINSLTAAQDISYGYADGDGANVMRAFADGKLMFTVNQLSKAEEYLGGMKDFLFIPMPKYDNGQTNYITPVHESCTVFGITYCTSKIRQTAAALEFLCAYSSRDVMPQYYGQILKEQFARDAQTYEIIDLIHCCVTTDFGYAWSHSMGDLGHIYRDCATIENKELKPKIADWNAQLEDIWTRLLIYSYN